MKTDYDNSEITAEECVTLLRANPPWELIYYSDDYGGCRVFQKNVRDEIRNLCTRNDSITKNIASILVAGTHGNRGVGVVVSEPRFSGFVELMEYDGKETPWFNADAFVLDEIRNILESGKDVTKDDWIKIKKTANDGYKFKTVNFVK